MNKILLSVLVLLLAGCGNSGKDTTQTDSLNTDSVVAEIKIENPAYYNGEYFVLNDSIWTKVGSSRELNIATVRDQYYSSKEIREGDMGMHIKRFFELDSMYKVSKEPQFDIGETVKVNVKFLDTLFTTSDYTASVWLLSYESYPACPSSSGTYANLSTFDKAGKLISTATVGDESGGADAPYYGTTSTETKIYKDGRIIISKKQLNGGPADEEDPDSEFELIETTMYSQEGTIDSKGIITLAKEKELSKKNEKKKYNN